MKVKPALIVITTLGILVGALAAWPMRSGWSDEPGYQATDLVQVAPSTPSTPCAPGEDLLHACPDGTSVPWCTCRYTGCQPECWNVGTRSEGWYDSCMGLRYEWTMCDGCQAVCQQIGTSEEGWYDSCGGDLIVHGTCRGDWQCAVHPEAACDQHDCTPEGQEHENTMGVPPCCDGLVPISCSVPGLGGVCSGKCIETSFCTRCGDGSCVPPENPCNCPADCE